MSNIFKYSIYFVSTKMKKFDGLIKEVGNLRRRGIEAYFMRKVGSWGNGAKVNCPKEFEGKKAIIVILKKNGE